MTSVRQRTVAIDIGGANLKFSDDRGERWMVPFEMWKRFDELAGILSRHTEDAETVLVTMTGELADNFQSRREGVVQIADAVQSIGRQMIRYYRLGGTFESYDKLMVNPISFAASNWHASGMSVSRRLKRPGLMIDIGSTTTDLIRLSPGSVDETADCDRDRLENGSLIYVGDRRTPVCGVVNHLWDNGRRVGVMNEWFATMDDVRLLLGFASPNQSTDTADGRPRQTRDAAIRMLRMIGTDLDDRSESDAVALASQVHQSVRLMIDNAIDRLGFHNLYWLGEANDLVNFSKYDIEMSLPGMPSDPCTAMVDLWNHRHTTGDRLGNGESS